MKENKHISLNEIGKELPFSVPENYFEQFASQIAKQIEYPHVSSRRLLRPWMYMAAMVVGVLLISKISFTIYQNNTQRNAANYESYVLSQVDETALLDCYVDETGKTNGK
jgi:hypothetical protein